MTQVFEHMQVTRSMHQHRPTVLELEQDGKWMGAAALLKVINTTKQDVEVAIMTDGMNPETARELHDVALACTMFGYLPPMRPISFCSLVHPNYKGDCLYPDCRKPHKCHGNRVIIQSREPLRLKLHMPHHKNQGKWEQAAIQYEIPSELAELLAMWLDGGHKELCCHLLEIGEPSCPFVFMNQQGKGYTTNVLGRWWRSWVKKQGGAEHLPPSMCRHIFVDERRSDDRAEGPSDKGASMAMGNSQKAWDTSYEKQRHFHPRDCQQAVNAMDIWRGSLLGSPCTPNNSQGSISHSKSWPHATKLQAQLPTMHLCVAGVPRATPSAVDTWRHFPMRGASPTRAESGGHASLLATLVPQPPQQHALSSIPLQRVNNCKRLRRTYVIESSSEEEDH